MIPFLIKKERVLYIDCGDTIINSDLRILYKKKFGKNLLCGVCDLFSKENKEKLNLKTEYINAGVLLLNLKKFKNYEKNLNTVLDKYSYFEYHDQDIINILFSKKIRYLDKRYNFQFPV